MKIIGKCKNCGQCCRDLRLEMTTTFSSKPKNVLQIDLNKQRDDFISKHIKDNPYLDFSQVEDIKIEQIEKYSFRLTFYNIQCRALIKKKGKYYCSIHKNKPALCEAYPSVTSEILKGCGYKKVKEKNDRQKRKK